MGTAPARAGIGAPWREPVTGLGDDDAIRETLEVVVEDIVAHTGFRVAVIAVRDSSTELKVVAVTGDERARSSLLGSKMPLSALDALLQIAQPWGNLHFVPDAGARPEAIDGPWSWIDEVPAAVSGGLVASDQWWTQQRWEKENALLAPLLREDGEVLGLVSVDLPVDGVRPSEMRRLALSLFVSQAERTVAAAARRTSETHQLRLAQAARLIVREAGMQHHVSELLPKARAALLLNFATQQVWIKSSAPDGGAGDVSGGGAPLMAPAAGGSEALPEALLPALSRVAHHCWREQSVLELSAKTRTVAGMEAVELAELLAFLSRHGVSSALVVPLGSGDTRLGSMILGRSTAGRVWSAAEKSVALDIGHDIGRSMVHTLWFEAQLRATEELRQYAEYKRELLMTMSHELQTPLASIRAHAELVKPDLAEDDTLRRGLTAIERGSDRLTKLVDDMLRIARVDDPRRPLDAEPVDVVETLRTVVEDVVRSEDVRLGYGPDFGPVLSRGREVVLDLPDAPVWIVGSRSELILVWRNLTANALKYTDEGGRIRVEVTRKGAVAEVTFSDDGIGIAIDEADQIFEDFYRSTSPGVRKRVGTGLGLGIVKRVVARHDGQVTVEVTDPDATTFRVALPIAGNLTWSH